MNKGLRLSLGLIIVCGLAVGVGACGGGDASSGSTGSAGDLSGTVTVWDFDYGSIPGHTEAIDQLTSEFEKLYPNVTVKTVPQPVANYEAIYQAAFTAREGPDVMINLAGLPGVLRWANGLEPLNDRISPQMSEEVSGWDACTAGFSPDGDRYGVPIGATSEVFYFNKKMFAKAGLPLNFQPKTWDELREAGEKLKAAGIQPFTGGNKEGYENGWWYWIAWETVNSSQEAIELGEGKLSYTDHLVTKALEPGVMMQEAGLYPSDRFDVPLFPNGAAKLGEEEGAMQIGLWAGGAYWGEYVPALGEKNVGIFFPPGYKYLDVIPEYCYSIPAFAGNKDAAWAYLKFLASKRGLEAFGKYAGTLPNRIDVELPGDAPIQARELVKAARENKTAIGASLTTPSVVLQGPMWTEVNEVLQGRETLEEAQEAMQEAAEKTAG